MPYVNVQEIDFASPAGSKLAIENNVTYPPAIFLDDKLMVKGKIFEEQIIAAIQSNNGAPA
jgi:protein-disulfide isomerase